MFVTGLVLLVLAAQLNATAIVPAAAGHAPPPWWVAAALLWLVFGMHASVGGLRG